MTSGFDRLARWYRALEYLAFGRSLERARRQHLPALAACTHILVLGEGDGRCLAALADIAADARIRVVDRSAGMLERAAQRLPPGAAARVTFEQADVRDVELPRASYDAVVTLFILDCFDTVEVERIVSRVRASLRPDALWVFADFVMPTAGWRRWRAALWIGGLYAFFRIATGLKVAALPPSEAIIERSARERITLTSYQHDMIHSTIFRV